jgi:hypothetical protein
MNTHNDPLICAAFEALIPDLLEGTLDAKSRERMDAHRLDCDACDSIVADLLDIRQQAANLPTLTPSRDLWSGIESRIQTEIVEFPRTPMPGEVLAVVATASPQTADHRPQPGLGNRGRAGWRIAAAASLLVAATAGITWSIASRAGTASQFTTDSLASVNSGLAVPVSATPMEESYDREISDLRRLVDEHRADMDSVTAAVLDRNLKVIDEAIAESKAALESSPESAFLLGRLNDAYATKLRTLRGVVAPRRG